MATYFQHLEPGDKLGKVTKLKYIDDISDDFIFYHFEDGTVCNKDFISEPDNADAFNGKFVMAELYSPTAVWTFDKKVISIDEKKTWTNPETGETFDIAPPGVQKNGQYGGGVGDVRAMAKDGQTRITATAPVFHGNKDRREDLSSYTLSVNPNACNTENGVTIDDNVKSVNISQDDTEQIQNVETQGYIEPVDMSVITTDNTSVYLKKDNFSYIGDDLLSNDDLFLDLNRIKFNNIHITIGDKLYGFSKQDFFEFIQTIDNKESSDNTTNNIKFIQDYLDEEDVLITNMIEKSKKVQSDIGMDISATLPPKEVYNTIKNVYSEDMADNFIKSLAYRIPVKCLIDAIAVGLSTYYDEEKSKMVTAENA